MKPQIRAYGTKQIIIRAAQLSRENFDAVKAWCNGDDQDKLGNSPAMDVEIVDGICVAELGDYILRYPNGEFNVMSPKMFALHFQLTDTENTRDGDMWPEKRVAA